jgi:hypothetical protein
MCVCVCVCVVMCLREYECLRVSANTCVVMCTHGLRLHDMHTYIHT